MAEDLIDTMRSFGRCVGIAAPQVGEDLRLCIVDCSEHPKATEHNGLLVLVDPVIVAFEGSEVGREGCLSIPDFTGDVRRAVSVTVRATSPSGDALEVVSTGFEARAIQHEIDHLDGVLFLDRALSVFPRKRYA